MMSAAFNILLLSRMLHMFSASSTNEATLVDISSHAGERYSFERYIQRFGRTYAPGTEEYDMRSKLFHDRVVQVQKHNALQLSWRQDVNHFTDRTDEELKQSLGFKRKVEGPSRTMATSVLQADSVSSTSASVAGGGAVSLRSTWDSFSAQILICTTGLLSLLGVWVRNWTSEKPHTSWVNYVLSGLVIVIVLVSLLCLQRQSVAHPAVNNVHAPVAQSCMIGSPCSSGFSCNGHGFCEKVAEKLPDSLDWSAKLPSGKVIYDQGACGSCWATSSAGILQLYGELLTNKTIDVSAQGMLGCSTNPNECGGQGGCQGSTPELALEWAAQHGVQTTAKEKYTASDNCPQGSLRSPPALTIKGYMMLETNKGDQAIHALVTAGPLLVSIAGGSLFSYGGGVFSGCPKTNPVVDHSVMMVGYGELDGLKYWRIRNSWGLSWGEKGFFSLLRHTPARGGTDAKNDKEPCAYDEDPSKGYACKDPKTHQYPKRLMVCGECGVLSDTLYPVGIAIKHP